jgi:hypothetical protein
MFTPQAVDFIFQCSEGIPRNINNLCDNAMIAAYSNGERTISRRIIEEVAENLDLLPRTDALLAADAELNAPEGHVLRATAADDLLAGQARTEQVKPRVFTEGLPFGNGHGTGYSNGNDNGYTNGHANGDRNGHASEPGYSNGAANNAYPNGNGNHRNEVPSRDSDPDVLEIGGTFYKL